MIQIEQYFNDFFKGTKNPSLDAMKYFMKEYNDFQKKMKFIHIAGTNGKGSCTEMISNILAKQGYKVGKFLSPHLIKYNERISINGKQILDEEMSEIIEELEPKIKEYNKNHQLGITLFELETIMALLYFYRKKVDFVVLETGLGGLYDSTNIISNPLVSVITSIGYDHMRILGDTLSKIAYQKAGIIKENSNTVFFGQTQEINEVFIKKCKEKNNDLHLITEEQIKNYSYDSQYQYFDYKNLEKIAVNLKGIKQIQNASICIESMSILNDLGYKISENSIKEGLSTVIHRGRMEVLNQQPLVVYDGAHNEPAIENLQKTIDMYYKDLDRVYIISILKRKDYKKMIELLMKDKDATFIFTSGNDENKYATSEELYETARKYDNGLLYKMPIEKAIEFAMNTQKNTVNFVIGSFYTYGTVVDHIKTLQQQKKML